MKHLNRLTVRALAFAIAFAICLPAVAGGRHHCQQLVVVKQVAVAVPVVYSTVSPYLYQESVDARIEKAVDRRLQALGLTAQQQKAEAPSLMSQKCFGCHNGTKARSFAGGLSGDEYKSFSRMVGLGVYPEGAEAMKPVIERLKAEGKAADVVAEILRMPEPAPAAEVQPPAPGELQ